jgi:hypothetical protein
VQYLGITKSKKMVTAELVRAATQEIFGMVSGLISVLERRDYKALAMIGDAAVDTLRTEIDRWVTDEDSAAFHKARAEQEDINHFYSALAVLMSLGIGQGEAERNISTVQRETPAADVKEIVRRVLEIRRKPFASNDIGRESNVADGQDSSASDLNHAASESSAQPKPPAENACPDEKSAKKVDGVGNFRIRKKRSDVSADNEHAVKAKEFDSRTHPASEMEI